MLGVNHIIANIEAKRFRSHSFTFLPIRTLDADRPAVRNRIAPK
jgi:hypothetical protein